MGKHLVIRGNKEEGLMHVEHLVRGKMQSGDGS